MDKKTTLSEFENCLNVARDAAVEAGISNENAIVEFRRVLYEVEILERGEVPERPSVVFDCSCGSKLKTDASNGKFFAFHKGSQVLDFTCPVCARVHKLISSVRGDGSFRPITPEEESRISVPF